MRLFLFYAVLFCSASHQVISNIGVLAQEALSKWTALLRQNRITEIEMTKRFDEVQKLIQVLQPDRSIESANKLMELIQKYQDIDIYKLKSNMIGWTEQLEKEKKSWWWLFGKKKRIAVLEQKLQKGKSDLSLLHQGQMKLESQIASVLSSNVKLAGLITKQIETLKQMAEEVPDKLHWSNNEPVDLNNGNFKQVVTDAALRIETQHNAFVVRHRSANDGQSQADIENLFPALSFLVKGKVDEVAILQLINGEIKRTNTKDLLPLKAIVDKRLDENLHIVAQETDLFNLKKIADLSVEHFEANTIFSHLMETLKEEEKKFFKNSSKIRKLKSRISQELERKETLEKQIRALSIGVKFGAPPTTNVSEFDERLLLENEIKRLEDYLEKDIERLGDSLEGKKKEREISMAESDAMNRILEMEASLDELPPVKQKSNSELTIQTNQFFEKVEKMKANLPTGIFTRRSARQQRLLEFNLKRAQIKLLNLEKELEQAEKIGFLRYKRLKAAEALENEQKKWRFKRNKHKVSRLEQEIARLTKEIDELLHQTVETTPQIAKAKTAITTGSTSIKAKRTLTDEETNDLNELKEQWKVSYKRHSELEESITNGKDVDPKVLFILKELLEKEWIKMSEIELKMSYIDQEIIRGFRIKFMEEVRLAKKTPKENKNDPKPILKLVESKLGNLETIEMAKGQLELMNVISFDMIPLLEKARLLNSDKFIFKIPILNKTPIEKAVTNREREHKLGDILFEMMDTAREKMSLGEMFRWRETLREKQTFVSENSNNYNESYLQFLKEEYKKVEEEIAKKSKPIIHASPPQMIYSG